MGRKRKVASVDVTSNLQLPPCRVCDGPGGGFHYGVNTCEACKGFFHRSSKVHDDFECKRKGECIINFKDPKICKKCRYEKCLNVGMAKQAIKTGRYTVQKRTNDTLEINHIKKTRTNPSTSTKVSYLAADSSSETNTTSNSAQKHRSEIYENLDSSNLQHVGPSGDDTSQDYFISSDCNNSFELHQFTHPNTTPSSLSSLSSPTSSVLSPDNTSSVVNISSPIVPSTSSSSDSLTTSPNMSIGSQCKNILNSFLSWDSPMTLCKLSAEELDIYALYQDTDTVLRIIDQGKEAHINPLLPTMSDEEFKEMAIEHIESCQLKHDMFGSMHRIPDQEYDQIYASTGLDADGRQVRLSTMAQTIEVHVRAISKFAKCIPGFTSLDIHDQVTLIKHARAEMLFVCRHTLFDTELGVILCADHKLRCRREASSEINNDEIVDRYKVMYQIYDKLKLKPEEKLLLMAITIMAPDRERSIKSRRVWIMHELLHKCLIDLFKQRFERPLLMWAKVISFLSELRTFSHFCLDTFRRLRLDKYSNAANSPLLREMLDGIFFETDGEEESEDGSVLMDSSNDISDWSL